MGQSGIADAARRQIGPDRYVAAAELQLSVFLTDLGWFGLVGRDEAIAALTIGHGSSDGVREAVSPKVSAPGDEDAEELPESDWLPQIRRRLERYAAGERVEFGDCRLDSPPRTAFQQRVLELTRGIPYGTTTTYGELAEQAGAPRAARAVGSVMASNRVPIIIPCHRIIAAGRKLGGFSAPSGVRLKEQMLTMEAGEE